MRVWNLMIFLKNKLFLFLEASSNISTSLRPQRQPIDILSYLANHGKLYLVIVLSQPFYLSGVRLVKSAFLSNHIFPREK